MRHPKIKTNKDYYCKREIPWHMLVHCLLDHDEKHFLQRENKKEIEDKGIKV
jgi:hypothetical protein